MARDQKELCKQLVNPSIYKYKTQTHNQQFCKQKTSFSQYSVLALRRVSRHADTWRSVVGASLLQLTNVSKSRIMSLHMRIFDPQTRYLYRNFTDDCLEHLDVTALHLDRQTDTQMQCKTLIQVLIRRLNTTLSTLSTIYRLKCSYRYLFTNR